MKNTFSFITISIYSRLAFAINPDRIYAETPKKYGFTFAEYKLKMADGALINVWDIEPKRKNKNNKVSTNDIPKKQILLMDLPAVPL